MMFKASVAERKSRVALSHARLLPAQRMLILWPPPSANSPQRLSEKWTAGGDLRELTSRGVQGANHVFQMNDSYTGVTSRTNTWGGGGHAPVPAPSVSSDWQDSNFCPHLSAFKQAAASVAVTSPLFATAAGGLAPPLWWIFLVLIWRGEKHRAEERRSWLTRRATVQRVSCDRNRWWGAQPGSVSPSQWTRHSSVCVCVCQQSVTVSLSASL